MKNIIILIIALLGVHTATGETNEKYATYADDKERYADLFADPYAARFLEFFLDPQHYHAMYKKTVGEERANGLWYIEQGEKAFPILLEVIRREEGNMGANRINHALSKALRHPGDKSALVKEVRRRLPEWRNAGFTKDQYSNLITMSFALLAAAGDESDIAIMRSFLDPEMWVYQDEIDKQVSELEARLASEEARPDKREDPRAISQSAESNSRGSDINRSKGKGGATAAPGKSIWLVLAAAILLPLIALALRVAMR